MKVLTRLPVLDEYADADRCAVMIGNDVLGIDTTIYGLLLILFIIFMPKGILGAFLEKMRGGKGLGSSRV